MRSPDPAVDLAPTSVPPSDSLRILRRGADAGGDGGGRGLPVWLQWPRFAEDSAPAGAVGQETRGLRALVDRDFCLSANSASELTYALRAGVGGVLAQRPGAAFGRALYVGRRRQRPAGIRGGEVRSPYLCRALQEQSSQGTTSKLVVLQERKIERGFERNPSAQIPQVACGHFHTCVITKRGKLYSFGEFMPGLDSVYYRPHKIAPTIVEVQLADTTENNAELAFSIRITWYFIISFAGRCCGRSLRRLGGGRRSSLASRSKTTACKDSSAGSLSLCFSLVRHYRCIGAE